MKLTPDLSEAAILRELGDRLAAHRLEQNLSQADLAREAGLSTRTVGRMEAGESSQVTNWLRLLRALQLLTSLDSWIPQTGLRPMEQLRLEKKRRRRASSSRGEDGDGSGEHGSEPPTPWTWGDEA